ncbi:MAG: hypothetical protein QHJ73_16130, partial [Armatimonadota bacterium]|nr:hypothetical protein [Armatimonadota bacterium]
KRRDQLAQVGLARAHDVRTRVKHWRRGQAGANACCQYGAQCRRKVIELRQQGGLLARAAAEMGEARDEGAPNLSLF